LKDEFIYTKCNNNCRFGLYGTPFEPELFELEIPPVTKSYSHPLTYAGLYGGEHMSNVGSGTFHLWGLKDVDFRDLLVGNPLNLKWGKLGSLSPKQQIQGLLEVEPLHFTCHAASDGTRIEKIDLGRFVIIMFVIILKCSCLLMLLQV
jgi:baculoviral IAP repeat-containing protein 6